MCRAIFFSGLPKAGKSVTLHAIFQNLVTRGTRFFLERVNPDQEGNWSLETAGGTDMSRRIKNSLKEKGEFFSPRFVERKLRDIRGLSSSMPLLLLDMGGIPSGENRLFVEAAKNAQVEAVILVLGEADVSAWAKFWHDLGIEPKVIRTQFGSGDFEAEKARVAKEVMDQFGL